jgi:hypothetical protein
MINLGSSSVSKPFLVISDDLHHYIAVLGALGTSDFAKVARRF